MFTKVRLNKRRSAAVGGYREDCRRSKVGGCRRALFNKEFRNDANHVGTSRALISGSLPQSRPARREVSATANAPSRPRRARPSSQLTWMRGGERLRAGFAQPGEEAFELAKAAMVRTLTRRSLCAWRAVRNIIAIPRSLFYSQFTASRRRKSRRHHRGASTTGGWQRLGFVIMRVMYRVRRVLYTAVETPAEAGTGVAFCRPRQTVRPFSAGLAAAPPDAPAAVVKIGVCWCSAGFRPGVGSRCVLTFSSPKYGWPACRVHQSLEVAWLVASLSST